jgi:adenylylsulfate kinase-like enzyme
MTWLRKPSSILRGCSRTLLLICIATHQSTARRPIARACMQRLVEERFTGVDDVYETPEHSNLTIDVTMRVPETN